MTEVTPVPKKGKPPRKAKQIPQKVRDEVRARSGGRCEWVDGGRCGALSVHLHHKTRRSQGGRHDAATLMAVCLEHHNLIHAHPARSAELGYLTRGN